MGIEDSINQALNEFKPASDNEIEIMKIAEDIQAEAKNIDAIVIAYSIGNGKEFITLARGNLMTCAGLALSLDQWSAERVYPGEE